MAESLPDDFSDLNELGIDISDPDTLTSNFYKCAKKLESIVGKLDNDTLLKMYAYYKQGTEGKCLASKPSWYDMKGKAKWEAWTKLGDMSKEEAKKIYIENILKLCSDFNLEDHEARTESWVKVSSMQQSKSDDAKNVADFVRDSSIAEIEKYLQKNDVNERDSEGMGLIHYASDIGNIQVLEFLLSYNANINLTDSEGQTALHYASSCGHYECAKFLLKNGAHKDILDNDGNNAESVASEESISKLIHGYTGSN